MLQDPKNSSVKLLLAEDVPFVVLSDTLLTQCKRWINFCMEQEGITHAWIGRIDERNLVDWMAGWPSRVGPALFSAQMIQSLVCTKEVVTVRDHNELLSGGLFPLLYKDQVIGVLGLLSNQTDYFKHGTLTWINALAKLISDDLSGRDETEEEKQIEQEITRILQSSLDINQNVLRVLELLAQTFEADAVTMLGFSQPARRLYLIATHGLGAPVLAKLRLYFEAGLAGRDVDKYQPVWIEDMQGTNSEARPVCRLDEEGFRGYLALPLTAHNDLAGLIEILWQKPQPLHGWNWGFLKRISEQVALVIQRADIFRDIRRRNEELQTKYNRMIEGLSRALELRDIETEGHTQRVSQLTMRLVEHMHIPREDWDAIRQGALLHDIGKLGIPDAILLKPGSLTPPERSVMQQHVRYGYNILAPFISARHTLDMTLYHHEHWDGMGYPYGLKAEQIPLVARLFTIIDVFDALRSDRPYRSAWSHSQVLHYLKEQAGRQFDPQIVKLFLEIAGEIK